MRTKVKNKGTKLTSVNLIDSVYRQFKIVSFQNDTTLQRIVNRCLELYATDEDFRKLVDDTTHLQISGSKY